MRFFSTVLFCLFSAAAGSWAQPADSIRKETIPPGYTQAQVQQLGQDFHATGELLYSAVAAVWTGPEQRAQVAKKFIREHPTYEYWIRTAHMIALASYDKLDQPDSIRALIPGWIAEYPNDPFALASAAYFYLYYDIDSLKAFDYAQRAVGLLDRYQNHPFFSEQYNSLDAHGLYNSAWLTLAWSTIKLGRYEAALDILNRSMRETPSTINDPFSPAPYHFLFGLAYEKQHKTDSALARYAEAYRYGEGRNRWTSMAEKRFIELAKKKYDLDTVPQARMQELMRTASGYSGVYFVDVTGEKGMGGRVDERAAWGDCDNDGLPDLLLHGKVIFHNKGDGEFEKIELPGENKDMNGGLWGDYDNDGLLDVFCNSNNREKVWHNDGDCQFTEVTAQVGNVTNDAVTEGAAWVDADNDGFLDLYIANYENWTNNSSAPYIDEFWHNEAGKTFVKKGAEFGLIEPDGKARAARGVAPCDFDNDGDVDIYVSNYRLADNFLFENNGPSATPQFVNTAEKHGIAGTNVSGYYGHTTGSAWGDYDNDGDFDLITANIAHPRYIDFNNRTMLYENLGAPDFRFRDRRADAGIVFEETQSDAGFADFDGDGWLDIYITSTYEDRRSFLYMNNHDGTFRQVTGLAGARVMDGFGWAVADYDLDGDLDLAVGTGLIYKTGFHLLENKLNDNPDTRVHWLNVRVKGEKNTWGYGAVVRATQDGISQKRQIVGARGTTSQDYPTAYFGFGKNDGPVELEVTLLGGKTIKKTITTLDRVIEIEE